MEDNDIEFDDFFEVIAIENYRADNLEGKLTIAAEPDAKYNTNKIKKSKVAQQLELFLDGMTETLNKIPDKMSEFSVETVELNLTVGAQGNIILAQGKIATGIKVVLKRKKDE